MRGKHPNSLNNLVHGFKKGMTPWNKGKKIGFLPKGAFKKGERMGKENPAYKHGLAHTSEYRASLAQKRRARIKYNGGYFTAEEFIELKNKQGNKCLACKRFDLKLVADHVIPLVKGGTNDISNIQILCSRCNNKKYTKDTDYRDLIEVSIIIPCFNQGEFACESIESALNQTIPCEIIFINDGSNDNSLEVAKKYPIRVVNQVNKGLSAARNSGIMWATGDYVLPLDCDDLLLPNAVEKILEKIKETNADIISPSFRSFGRASGNVILMPNPTIEDFKIANRIGYCSAIKRSRLLEVGGYSPRMFAGYEDLHLWFDLLRRGATIETIPEVLWLYRTKEKSMWHDALLHHEELMAQIRKDFPEVTNIINDPLPNANS